MLEWEVLNGGYEPKLDAKWYLTVYYTCIYLLHSSTHSSGANDTGCVDVRGSAEAMSVVKMTSRVLRAN